MDDQTGRGPEDLTGTADERRRRLAELTATRQPSAEWLQRQLEAALAAWADDETRLDIDDEARADF